jgi:hypothetical protein
MGATCDHKKKRHYFPFQQTTTKPAKKWSPLTPCIEFWRRCKKKHGFGAGIISLTFIHVFQLLHMKFRHVDNFVVFLSNVKLLPLSHQFMNSYRQPKPHPAHF